MGDYRKMTKFIFGGDFKVLNYQLDHEKRYHIAPRDKYHRYLTRLYRTFQLCNMKIVTLFDY